MTGRHDLGDGSDYATHGPVPGAPRAPEWMDTLVASCTSGDLHAILPDRRTQAAAQQAEGRSLRDSAVLVLLSGDAAATGPTPPDDATVLLTHRAPTLRSHSGQLSFPGGRADPGDGGPVGTALRESVEETGLDPAGVDALAVTPPLFIPASNYSVYPVLGYWRTPSPVGVQDEAETARVMEVSLDELLDPAHRFLVRYPSGGWMGPAFHVDDLVLWGFTAGVLSAMLHVAGWEREWDTTDVRDLFPTLEASANGERHGPLSEPMAREARAAGRGGGTVAGVPGLRADGGERR